jgi:hypothetical protein
MGLSKKCGTFDTKFGVDLFKMKVHMLYYNALLFTPWVILVGIHFKEMNI